MSRSKKVAPKKKMRGQGGVINVEILSEMIGARMDISRCIRLMVKTKDEVIKIDLTPTECNSISDQLLEKVRQIDHVREAYDRLDEIDCYLDSMQSTVTNARDAILEDWDDALDGVRSDLQGEMRDLDNAIEEL